MISKLASQSINGRSDRLVQLNHLVSKDEASIPDISVAAMNSTTIRTQLVRILHLRYKTACFPWKNEGSGTTLATHSTTHQVLRQRTRRRFPQGQHLQAWTCMDRHRKPKQLANMRKTLGKPGFTSGEDRIRTFGCFPCVFEEFERQGERLVT
jgi:hypothetical protein